jgi:cytochrome c oxidase subunit 3
MTLHAAHFDSIEKQAHASRLGMWIFLASELLLFAGLFALYAAYRAHAPAAFHFGATHSTKVLGSINTAVLLTSSTCVAPGVHALREGRHKLASLLVLVTMLFGIVFLGIKFVEYAKHFEEGIQPGGQGYFFVLHPDPGLAPFWTLYYVSTGLHAIHVFVGTTILGFALVGVAKRVITVERAHVLENAALYWHLVDLIWIFLWPLYYLV